MRFFVHRHQIHFDDTMAYGSHHFLTNLKFQCGAREALLFLAEPDGRDSWREALDGIELLTQQGYARNLNPVGLGARVVVLMSCDEVGYSSFRLCFRVVDEAGKPVTCGWQLIVVRDRTTGSLRALPALFQARLAAIREPDGVDLAEAMQRGGPALPQLFPPELSAAAAAIACGRASLPEGPFLDLAIEAQQPAAPLVLVCPGQGSYDEALLSQAMRNLPWFRDLAAEIEALCLQRLGIAVRVGPGEDHGQRLYREQLGIFLGALVCGRLLMEQHGPPAVVLGHSVGEVAALVLAEVLSPRDGARVIVERTRALHQHGATGGLVAVQSSPAEVGPLLEDGQAGWLAVVNHRRQVVVAGNDQQLATLLQRAGEQRCRRVAADYPFHSPLLMPAVAPLAHALGDLAWRTPRWPVHSALERAAWSGRWHLPTLLASHLVRPLDFAAAVTDLVRQGPRRFAECSRRGVVSRLITRILGPSASSGIVEWDSVLEERLGRSLPGGGVGTPASAGPDSARDRLKPELQRAALAIVGVGVCLPGAANVDAYTRLLEEGGSTIEDRRASDPACSDDLLGPPEGAPDRTYTYLTSRVGSLPPWPSRLAADSAGLRSRICRLAACALDECLQSLGGAPSGRAHLVIGSTADGSDAFDDAIALERLHAAGLVAPAVASAALRQLGGTAAELDHHQAFQELARAALGPAAETTVVDAACASSLYAVDVAARLLAQQEADLVIAGGAFAPGFSNNCLFAQFRGLSPTGSWPLDARADGVVFGEGAAFVALEPLDRALANGHQVLGVLRGIGLSSDGRTASPSKPSDQGQELALRRAYQVAGVPPDHVQYVEAHATGTPVGDRTEFTALNRFFGTAGASGGSIALGSVKSQLGHTGWAAGAASLIKTLIALNRKQLPVQHAYRSSSLPLAATPFTVLTEPRAWPEPLAGRPSLAGVNSFGFGGPNCHVVVESFDAAHRWAQARPTSRPVALCCETSRDYTARDLEQLRAGCREGPRRFLPDVADTMDPSQLVGLDLADRLFQALPATWKQHADRIGVVAYMPGKTGVIVAANDRLLAGRLGRLLAGWGSPLDVPEALRRLGVADKPTGPYTLTGGMPNITAGRVCQAHDLKGPNLVVSASSRGPAAARAYATSLVADGTCAAVLLLTIEPRCESWLPRGYRAAAELIAQASLASAEGWPTASRERQQPAEALPSTGSFDTSAEVRFHAVELAPWPDLQPGTVAADRLLVLLDARARQHWRPGPTATACRVAELADAQALPLDGAAGVVLVQDLAGGPDEQALGNQDDWRRLLDPLLNVCRTHYEALAAGRLRLGHICLRAFTGSLPLPGTGLVGGFCKALGRGLPQGQIAAVQCADDDLAAGLATVAALWQRPGPPWEAFRRAGAVYRSVLREVPEPAERSAPALVEAGTVVLVTGGARGITAELVAMLLERFQCRVALLGRSDPATVGADWHAFTAADVTALEADFHRRQAASGMKLRDSRAAFERLQAAHEVFCNLKRFRSLPGSVDYYCCDVTRPDAVDGCVRSILDKWGPVGMVLHGAGIQVSGRLDRKDRAQFWRIIDTKLSGLQAILRALDANGCPPRHVHLATSAFSYFGNDGQEDYGAANEALNRLADVQATRSGPGGPNWSAMAWLAWDGIGMTRGSEYRTLARDRRMRGLQGREGGELLARLFAGRPRNGANVLMTAIEQERYQVEQSTPVERIEDWPLDWRGDPLLEQHRADGRPVCPACISIPRMAHAAQALVPDLVPVAVEECRFERLLGVRIPAARVRARLLPSSGASRLVEVFVEADLRTPDGRLIREGAQFASCRVRFGNKPPIMSDDPFPRLSDDARSINDPFHHPQSPVRHGPSYDCLADIRISQAVNRAMLVWPLDRSSPLWHQTPLPMAVDGLLRVSIFHDEGGQLPVYVPVRIDKITWDASVQFDQLNGLELIAQGPTTTGGQVHCRRAQIRTVSGAVLLEITGLTGHRFGQVSVGAGAGLTLVMT
jgi:acyl transferase domain-containing protein/NAD(P)-dependent dehydrogenase (short-subunit alcohol dehydrogenase family)